MIEEIDEKDRAEKMKMKLLQQKKTENGFIRLQQQVSILNLLEIVNWKRRVNQVLGQLNKLANDYIFNELNEQ